MNRIPQQLVKEQKELSQKKEQKIREFQGLILQQI